MIIVVLDTPAFDCLIWRQYFGVYLSLIVGVQPYRQGRHGMERSNLKAGNFSDGNGVVKIAVHKVTKNARKELLSYFSVLQSEHHAALSLIEARQS
jgi:hypothetical protein